MLCLLQLWRLLFKFGQATIADFQVSNSSELAGRQAAGHYLVWRCHRDQNRQFWNALTAERPSQFTITSSNTTKRRETVATPPLNTMPDALGSKKEQSSSVGSLFGLAGPFKSDKGRAGVIRKRRCFPIVGSVRKQVATCWRNELQSL